MDALLSLLLFTGLIFLVMRLARARARGVDPVCGMKVGATDGFVSVHGGVEYRFCSLTCLESFEHYKAPAHHWHAA